MTTALKEIVGELSGLSAERQQVAATVIRALWKEEHAEEGIHPEWEAELKRRHQQIESGEAELISESSMEAFVADLLQR